MSTPSSDSQRAPDEFVPLDEAAARLGYAETAWREAAAAFPVRWPAAYLALAEGDRGEAIRRMGVPNPRELVPDADDLPDPVGERGRTDVPFVVRKHRDRAILLVTARCHFYCRFCFRRSFPDGDHRDPTAAQLEAALDHLAAQPDLTEVIVSGGDPFVLRDDALASILQRLAAMPQVETIRIHTRAPVHHPARVTPALVAALRETACWVVTHFNHSRELEAGSRRALSSLIDGGVPVLNQSVLLAGVNDDAEELARTCRALYRERVKPYYLHHPDRVPGNAAFRVTIPRGLELYRSLRDRVPGPALPAYVLDLPDGTGKVPVESLVHRGGRRWSRPDGASEFEDIGG